MKTISKHLEVYLVQKESLFSILARISVNAIVFLFPLIFLLDDYLLYFLYKWLVFLTLLYHLVYTVKKLLISQLGISAFFMLSWLIPLYTEVDAYEEPYPYIFYYLLLLHIGLGVCNTVSDYALSDLDELVFFNFDEFKMVLGYFFSLYLGVFLTFWYF